MDFSFNKIRWDLYVMEQNMVCKKFNVEIVPLEQFAIVGLADERGDITFNALRHPQDNYSGWFLWLGKWSDGKDFFRPVHACHLMETKPQIIKYLGLPPGYRILIDDQGYEDVWFDESLLSV